MLAGLYATADYLLRERREHKPIVYRQYRRAGEQFDYRAYGKAGWVLHMLRTELGVDMFRKCVKAYLERHALDSVVTEDFRSVIEEFTGRSFDRFFDQWIYHGRHPDLKVSYNWSQKDKLAKISVEQTHKVDENVMLFHFDTKVRFIIDGKIIDREINVDSKRHDFYFALSKAPEIVRFDPDYGLLADIKFDKPTAMLYVQLENTDDIIGRLRAIDVLKTKKDKKTVAALKNTLKNDPSDAVRRKASSALRQIHNDDAFEALADSLSQSDASVRLQVVGDIGGFYRPESLKLTRRVLRKEKNPEIIARAIRTLGQYHDKRTRQIILEYLECKSFRNSLASAAIEVIRELDDTFFIEPLRRTLANNERQFTSHDFARALGTLAYISRNQDDKEKIRTFLTGYANHPKNNIQSGAIRALGTLGDPKAIPVVQTFTGDDPSDRVQRAAKDALRELREKKQIVPDEIVRLREIVDKLGKETEKLRDDLEDVKSRLEAKEQAPKDGTGDDADQ
jgi:aminopeptidase N